MVDLYSNRKPHELLLGGVRNTFLNPLEMGGGGVRGYGGGGTLSLVGEKAKETKSPHVATEKKFRTFPAAESVGGGA